MVTLTVDTPYGEPLTLSWKDRKVASKGSKRVLTHWNFLQDGGLFGMYGHTFNPENCFFRDLIAAVSSAYGPDKFTLSPEAKKQVAKEVQHDKDNPLPKGAVT